MAEDLNVPPRDSEPVAAPPASPVPVRSEPPRSYRARFGLAYAVLAAVVGAAVGTFIVLAGRDAGPVEREWSSWKPEAKGAAAANEIATHVARRYRLPSGNQLVAIVPSPAEVQDVTVRAIAVRPTAVSTDVSIVPASDSLMYILCGLGERCSIREGQPSEERHQLLRREALELALYTFKYDEDVDTVVTFLPPPGGAETSFVVFFRREDLRELLARPLQATLAEGTSSLAGRIARAEVPIVDSVTLPRVFAYGFQQLQDGTAILVLSPPRAPEE